MNPARLGLGEIHGTLKHYILGIDYMLCWFSILHPIKRDGKPSITGKGKTKTIGPRCEDFVVYRCWLLGKEYITFLFTCRITIFSYIFVIVKSLYYLVGVSAFLHEMRTSERKGYLRRGE